MFCSPTSKGFLVSVSFLFASSASDLRICECGRIRCAGGNASIVFVFVTITILSGFFASFCSALLVVGSSSLISITGDEEDFFGLDFCDTLDLGLDSLLLGGLKEFSFVSFL